MSTRDYTDSESETEAALLGAARADSRVSTPAAGASPLPKADGKRQTALRPHLAHLHDLRGEPAASPGDRSSPSPPPPIRLKFTSGIKHARSSAMYSDSDDDTPAGGKADPDAPDRSPPAKKRKGSKRRGSTAGGGGGGNGGSGGASAAQPSPSLPAQHRKAYDWLTPSTAGASHHGPPDRGERHSSAAASVAAGSAAGDDEKPSGEETGRESTPPSEKKKPAARRKNPDGPAKGRRAPNRKTEALKEGSAVGRSSPLATPSRHSMSREASPELFDNMLLATATVSAKEKREREREQHIVHYTPREPSPPFVPADAAALGIPVFPNPIAMPKLVLGPFPKVTSFFAPFDNKPFRREHTRDWALAERSITGIAGGTLKFKTWRPGPPSELGRVLAAQREAEALAKQRKKEERAERGANEATPERPTFHHSNSSDSIPVVAGAGATAGSEGAGADGADGDNASEAGDGDAESVAGSSVRESPTPRGRGSAAKRGRPRKSKLANEIILTEPEDNSATPAGSPLPSAEPDAAVA